MVIYAPEDNLFFDGQMSGTPYPYLENYIA